MPREIVETSVRLPISVVQRVDEYAASEGVSRNAVLVQVLAHARLPTTRPGEQEGRQSLILRLPPKVRRLLQQIATQQKVSLTRTVEIVVNAWLDGRDL